MSSKKIERTETYVAVDEDGNECNIDIYTTFNSYTPINGPEQWVAGEKTHKMQESGNHVNMSPDGTLVEFDTGRKMRRI